MRAVRSALEHRWLKGERRQYQKKLQQKVVTRTRAFKEQSATLARLQNEISNMEKLSSIGVLAASVSHEINNPLNSMIGFAELIADMDGIADQVRKYASVIFLEGQKIQRLTEQLLGISRQGRTEKKVQDLNIVVSEVLSLTDHHLTRFEDVEVDESLADGSLMCKFDRSQLQQVLLNLFLNAAQAMPTGGRLSVKTYRETRPDLGPGVTLAVSDTGLGIPPEMQEEIFKPFFTTKQKGTGLGLKICRDIVLDHEGVIDLESAPEKGTTFRVWIPRGTGKKVNEQQSEQTEREHAI